MEWQILPYCSQRNYVGMDMYSVRVNVKEALALIYMQGLVSDNDKPIEVGLSSQFRLK